MADKPIIFSGPMVRALIEGRKVQTRRVIKQQAASRFWQEPVPAGWLSYFCDVKHRFGTSQMVSPSYTPGDRLYVRESFVTGFDIADETGQPVGDRKVWYRATDAGLTWYDADSESTLDNPPWKPSIHMPRWASRLTLTVTDVRVQRLQDISEADCEAEGITPVTRRFPPLQGCPNQLRERTIYEWSGGWSVRAADAYAALWNSLHGPDAWDANPWVVALTFTVEKRNIDAGGHPMTDTTTPAVTAMLDGVTPGPWRASETWRPPVGNGQHDTDANGNIFWGYSISGSNEFGGSILPTLAAVHNFPETIHANARFIAAARQLVPALLAERDAALARAEAAEARVAELEAANASMQTALKKLGVDGSKGRGE